MNWLVTWVVINIIMVPFSHGFLSGYDEYGRYWEKDPTTLEIRYDTSTVKMEKLFSTYKEAKAFLDEGEESCKQMQLLYPGQTCNLQDFNIEEVPRK